LKETPHQQYATLPPILFIDRQQVACGQDQIQPTYHRAKGQDEEKRVSSNPAEMYEQLLRHGSRAQGGSVEQNKGANRKRTKIKGHSSETNATDPWTKSQTQFRSGYTTNPCRDKVPDLVRKHAEYPATNYEWDGRHLFSSMRFNL
jgi:hypothetical protein